MVKPPLVAVLAPDIVSVVAPVETSIVEVVAAVNVKLRSVEAVAPVYCNVPPPNTKFAAAFVAWPRFPAMPPLPIVATLKMPWLIVVTPVKVFTPERVHVPAPVFVSPPVPLVIPEIAPPVPVPLKDKRNPPLANALEMLNVPLFVKVAAAPNARFAMLIVCVLVALFSIPLAPNVSVFVPEIV